MIHSDLTTPLLAWLHPSMVLLALSLLQSGVHLLLCNALQHAHRDEELASYECCAVLCFAVLVGACGNVLLLCLLEASCVLVFWAGEASSSQASGSGTEDHSLDADRQLCVKGKGEQGGSDGLCWPWGPYWQRQRLLLCQGHQKGQLAIPAILAHVQYAELNKSRYFIW